MYTKALVFAGLASFASAHIKMASPVPYGADSLNNSPLEADGSDFPCKQRPGVYEAGSAKNVFAQGSEQELKFIGSAVHGGGSCQVSVTEDLQPNANSVWKVIRSIEGGCPAQGQEGNMPENANAEIPYAYNFTIPEKLAAGKYTLAWTWFNKIGNREQYMNCAPLEVTGQAKDKSYIKSLPDMFVANIGNDCGTVSSKDVVFPDPGEFLVKMNGATDAFAAPTGSGCAAAKGGNSGGGGAGAGAGGSNPAPTSSKTETEPTAPAEKPSIPGGVFITASGNSPAAPTQPPSAPEPQPSPKAPVAEEPVVKEPVVKEPVAENPVVKEPVDQSPAPETPAPAPGAGSGSGGFAAGTACSSEGSWNCVNGSSFQRCASGAWSPVMALSAGVTCSGGEAATLSMDAKQGKRSMRHASRIRII